MVVHDFTLLDTFIFSDEMVPEEQQWNMSEFRQMRSTFLQAKVVAQHCYYWPSLTKLKSILYLL